MADGWSKLGEALGGVTPARRADIEAKMVNQLAQRDLNTARARDALAKSEALASLGTYFADLDDPENLAGVARSGVNINTLYGGVGQQQRNRFRQEAVDAATAGDFGGANARLFGVASGPVEIPKVSGNMLLSNRLVPGGGDVSVTPIGQSQIRANDARAQASIINANKPRSSGGGRAGAPKLGEIEKARMSAELKALDPLINAALDEVARNQGATAGPGVRKLADAEARLADLQARQQAIFDKYEGGGAAPAADSLGAELEPDDGIPVVDSGQSLGEAMSGEAYYQAPDGGQRRAPDTRQDYRDAFAIARKYEAEAEAAIKAGAPRDMVRARLKAMIEKEMGR